MHEVDWNGTTDEEAEKARNHKVDALLNIAACNIKTQNWLDALAAANEVLKLEPDNVTALHRRAKATYLPINSSVEDFKNAVKDLKRVQQLRPRPSRRIDTLIQQLSNQANINRKRERETYSKMFFPTAKQVDNVERGEQKETQQLK